MSRQPPETRTMTNCKGTYPFADHATKLLREGSGIVAHGVLLRRRLLFVGRHDDRVELRTLLECKSGGGCVEVGRKLERGIESATCAHVTSTLGPTKRNQTLAPGTNAGESDSEGS